MHVLTLALEDEYKLYRPPLEAPSPYAFLQELKMTVPEVCAETNSAGLAKQLSITV